MGNTVDKTIVNYFNNLFDGNGVGNLILVVISLLLTILLSGIVGYEREYRGHPAGLRTHVLVALSSAIVMIVSIYGVGYENRDTMRLAAQVVSGIGFLGAGTIIQTGVDIKGLTTATTLWLSMAIGLAAGAGSFLVAGIGTMFAVISLIALKPLEKLASKKNPVLLVVCPTSTPVMRDLLEIATKHGLYIKGFETQIVNLQRIEAIRMILHFGPCSYNQIEDFVKELQLSVQPLEIKIC